MRTTYEQRFLSVAGMCSALVVLAGFFALQSALGVQIAAVLLTVSIMLALAGFPYARDCELGWSIAVLVAAVLPLFFVLYAIGHAIFQQLGAPVAGGLLIGAGSVLVCFTAWYSLKLRAGQSAHR